jgi:hypothetical protein
MPLIASIDGPNRDIYLSADTVGALVNPIDIYQEMRAIRRTDESLRQYDIFMSAFGNVPKGGGKFTERYVRLNLGARIIPFDISHQLTITGTIITDDGQEGVACFDRTPLSASTVVDINYVPPQVEVIQVSSGSGLDASQDAKLTEVYSQLNNIEGVYSHQEVMRILLAAMAGKVTGADGSTIRFRDLADSLDRIIANVDGNGNRTGITLDVS